MCGPDNKMTTLPDWTEALPVDGLAWLLFLWYNLDSSSAGYQVLALFLNLVFGDPPKAIDIKYENTEMGGGGVLCWEFGLKMDGVSSDVFGEFVGESSSWGWFSWGHSL